MRDACLVGLVVFAVGAGACSGDDAAPRSDDVGVDVGTDTGSDGGDAACLLPCGSGCCEPSQACDETSGICICVPKTCAEKGWTCGDLDDGCGDKVSCGDCATGFKCDALGTCVPCEPDPEDELCGQLGRECGVTTTLDSCRTSRVIDCGACPGGDPCLPTGECAQ